MLIYKEYGLLLINNFCICFNHLKWLKIILKIHDYAFGGKKNREEEKYVKQTNNDRI